MRALFLAAAIIASGFFAAAPASAHGAEFPVGAACDKATATNATFTFACITSSGNLGAPVGMNTGGANERSEKPHRGARRFFDGVRYAFGERWVSQVKCAQVFATDGYGHPLMCSDRDGLLAVYGGVNYAQTADLDAETCAAKRFVLPNGNAVACIDRKGDLYLSGHAFTKGR
jgi:hypothetical protein